MILYANGCSMTYGTEIGGEIFNKDDRVLNDMNPTYREKHAWPNVLSILLNMNSINDAMAGSSNSRIFRTTIDWTSKYLKEQGKPKNLFVVIGWSHPSRKEYKIYDKWLNILPGGRPPIIKDHLKIYNFHLENFLDELQDSFNTLQCILSLQSWFKINQIPYLFYNALHNEYSNKDDLIQNLLFHIDRRRYFKVDDYNKCMYDEIIGLPRGPRNHPLEEGHNHMAKILYDYIIENRLQEYD